MYKKIKTFKKYLTEIKESADPRWHPEVVKSLDKMKDSSKPNNLRIMKVLGDDWNSWGKVLPEVVRDFPRKVFYEFNGENVVKWNSYIHKKESKANRYIEKDIEKDFKFIKEYKVPSSKRTPERIYKLYKTKSGDPFLVRITPEEDVVADSLTFYATEKGNGNWSGAWKTANLI